MKTITLFLLGTLIIVLNTRCNLDNSRTSYQDTTPRKEVVDSDSTKHIFYYDNAEQIFLNGTKVVSKNGLPINGRIEFEPTEVRIYQGNGFERYDIKNITVAPEGALGGSILLTTENNQADACKIGILEDGGYEFVIAHFTELEAMMKFYINKGFTLDLGIYLDNKELQNQSF